jgi:hypothetical protein
VKGNYMLSALAKYVINRLIHDPPQTFSIKSVNKHIIVHALNQYVGKLNIVLKTFKKTKNIG